MPKPPPVSMRVKCSTELYGRIGEYRHQARHESRQQALVTLISAGLAALQQPVALPAGSAKPEPLPRPAADRKLVAYAGKNGAEAQ